MLRRGAAWIVTGPLGHLYAGLADWLELLLRYLWARLRGRDPWEEGQKAFRRR
jgi:hypothetical protein